MPRPRHPALTEIGTAFHRLYQAEREIVLRPEGATTTAVDPARIGTALDAALAHAMSVPALRRAREKRMRIQTMSGRG